MNRFSTPVGILLGLIGVFGAQILDHGSPMALLNVSALVLIVFGTVGATLASTGLDQLTRLPAWFRRALQPPVQDLEQLREMLVEFARKARRAGLLQLEQETQNIQDEYLKRGLDNAIAGMEPEAIETQMQAESESLYAHDLVASQFFEAAGGYSPTMGIIGTVVGLISVLSNVSDVTRLAASIATAFTATLWGILLANLVWLPVGMRLRRVAQDMRRVREIEAAAIVAIARGDSSRQLERQLASMLAGEEQTPRKPKPGSEHGAPAGARAETGQAEASS
jgi:chemotaxis protein MotA